MSNKPKQFWCNAPKNGNCRAEFRNGKYHTCPELKPGDIGHTMCNRDIITREIRGVDSKAALITVLEKGLERLGKPFTPNRVTFEKQLEMKKQEQKMRTAEKREMKRIREENDTMDDFKERKLIHKKAKAAQRRKELKRKRDEEEEENMLLTDRIRRKR